jgi:hypothetical protein
VNRKLHISDRLALPADTITSTLVVYGGRGMGKSVCASVLAEELSISRHRFAVIDPMGVWWGLRYSADGKGPGIEVLILGGRHGDIPIEPGAGEVVADLVVDENIDVIIDISRYKDGRSWSIAAKVRFVNAYIRRLFERQGERRRPLMQIIDEAARFCPQIVRAGETDVAMCMSAIAVMVEEGRNNGIGVLLISQRSARLNKDVAELADCMIAFRTVGPNSLQAILDWLGGHVAKERHRQLTEEIRKLPRGSALVVSPGWLEFEGIVQIRMRRTFDSSATPKPGEERRASGQGARVDLGLYADRMQETIERATANDPSELKKRLAAANAELTSLRAGASSQAAGSHKPDSTVLKREFARGYEEGARVTVVALHREAQQRLRAVSQPMEAAIGRLANHVNEIAADRDRIADCYRPIHEILRSLPARRPSPRPVPTAVPAPAAASPTPARIASQTAGGAELSRLQRALLTVLAEHPEGLSKGVVLLHANYRSSGDTSTAFAAMSRSGWIEALATGVRITDAGMAALGDFEPLPKGAALLTQLLEAGNLQRVEKAILKTIASAGSPMRKGEILAAASYKSSGDTSTAFARLRRFGYIHESGGGMALSPHLTDGAQSAY